MKYREVRLRVPVFPVRFSLRLLLGLMLVLACAFSAYFAGHRSGYEHGYSAGRWSLEAKMRSTKVYNVADLIGATNPQKPLQDFDSLVELITTTVTPPAWESNGGDAAIEAFSTNLALVVQHSNEGHVALAKFLEKLREEIRVSQTAAGRDLR